MKTIPRNIAAFLEGKRIIVAGVSRSGKSAANAIFRKLRDTGHEVIPLNPNASELEGSTCYPDVSSVPGDVHGIMIATHPSIAPEIARAALKKGIRHIWFHRSFGEGSVAPEAVQACRDGGVEPIVGGCPLMYCPPVDPGHRLFRWILSLQHRVPG
jgi:predicted CoA-binding protein